MKKGKSKNQGVTTVQKKRSKMPQTKSSNGFAASNGHNGYEMEDGCSFLFTSESVGEGHPGTFLLRPREGEMKISQAKNRPVSMPFAKKSRSSRRRSRPRNLCLRGAHERSEFEVMFSVLFSFGGAPRGFSEHSGHTHTHA